jgi:hypothetical protein
MTRNNADFQTQAAGDSLLTPEQLHTHVQGMLSDTHPKLTNPKLRTERNKVAFKENVLADYDFARSAKGDCGSATAIAHPFMPKGSAIVKYMMPHFREKGQGDEDSLVHFVHHVPTTKGVYVVDFTHSQFRSNSGVIVEPAEKYANRGAIKKRPFNRTMDDEAVDVALKGVKNRKFYELEGW